MEFSESVLFTTTCEGQVSNIRFESESTLICEMLKSLELNIIDHFVESKEVTKTQMDIIQINCESGIMRVPNISEEESEVFATKFIKEFKEAEKSVLPSSIMSIGCNYGEFKTYEYIKLITPIKKSNRGRKKKDKKKTSRKRIGNGEYFNSQVTVTIKDPIKLDTIEFYKTNTVSSEAFTLLKACMYHVKIYTNGKFQVPFVRDEDITTALPVVRDVVELIAKHDLVKPDITMGCEIEYIKSIMKNYRFSIVEESTLIDLKLLQQYFMSLKQYYETKSIETEGVFISKDDMGSLAKYFDSQWDILGSKKITLVKFNCDTYTGLVCKFLTPIESKPTKETTASIFDSGKINIYGSNSREQSEEIKQMIKLTMLSLGSRCLYTK